MSIRVIPSLLLSGQGLVKTVKFNKQTYIGDPINAIRIFNDKEVDELVFLDILATKEDREPNYEFIAKLAGECFMPLAYGGGIKSIEQIRKLNSIGVEKIIINTSAFLNPNFIKTAVDTFGSSTIVISLDVKKDFWGNYRVYTTKGTDKVNESLSQILQKINDWDVGEVIVNSIDRDGTMIGYDEALLRQITDVLTMPVVALGGAGKIEHLKSVIKNANVSAVAAGSLFVFYGSHKAVLINYPSQLKEINS